MVSKPSDHEDQESLDSQTGCKATVARHLTTLFTVIAVIIAIISGILIRNLSPHKWTPREIMYLEFPGEMFLRALKMLILPLIISSLVSSLGNLDSKLSSKIGARAICYYLISTTSAIVLGIILVLAIHPGHPSTTQDSAVENPMTRTVTTADTVLDLIRNLLPPNLVEACSAQYLTDLKPPIGHLDEQDIDLWTIKATYGGGMNILGLVVFSIILGLVIGGQGESGKPLLAFFSSLSECTMTITSLVIKTTPIGVMFLILPRIVAVTDIQAMLGSVGWYTLTVLLGLFVHGFLVLPMFYFVVTRKNPYTLIGHISSALMTAFGTSSSSATLPVTIRCLERNVRLDQRIVRFLVPVGATINMDGTALYEAVAAIFIAQSRGMELSLVKIVIISITATAASVGAAGIPQAGLVTMVIVLNAVGLPVEDVALIFAVDWFLDRFRTLINVMGDSFGSAVIAHLCRNDLRDMDLDSDGRGIQVEVGRECEASSVQSYKV